MSLCLRRFGVILEDLLQSLAFSHLFPGSLLGFTAPLVCRVFSTTQSHSRALSRSCTLTGRMLPLTMHGAWRKYLAALLSQKRHTSPSGSVRILMVAQIGWLPIVHPALSTMSISTSLCAKLKICLPTPGRARYGPDSVSRLWSNSYAKTSSTQWMKVIVGDCRI